MSNDRYDAARHRVNPNPRVGEPVKKALSRVPVQKVKTNLPLPEITLVSDRKSRTTDQWITAGHCGDVTGEMLKIVEQDRAEQGVFSMSTQKTQEVKIPYLHQNMAKTLQVEWPDPLKAGQEYRLEVRTTVNGGNEVRTGSSATLFKVK